MSRAKEVILPLYMGPSKTSIVILYQHPYFRKDIEKLGRMHKRLSTNILMVVLFIKKKSSK